MPTQAQSSTRTWASQLRQALHKRRAENIERGLVCSENTEAAKVSQLLHRCRHYRVACSTAVTCAARAHEGVTE